MRSAVLAVSLLFALGVAAPAQATLVLPQDVGSMSREADWIVRGTVANQYASWDAEHRRIYTFTEIEVMETLHRKDREPEAALVVRTLGGEVGDVGMKVEGTARFEVGEEVLLFLRRSEAVTGTWMVVGMSQGLYRVTVDEQGVRQLKPGAQGLGYARRRPGQPMAIDETTTLEPMSLPAMRARITRELAAAPSAPSTPAAGPRAPQADPVPQAPTRAVR